MLREMSFSGIRMGLYEPIKYQLGGTDRAHTSVFIKVQAAATAGMLGFASFLLLVLGSQIHKTQHKRCNFNKLHVLVKTD